MLPAIRDSTAICGYCVCSFSALKCASLSPAAAAARPGCLHACLFPFHHFPGEQHSLSKCSAEQVYRANREQGKEGRLLLLIPPHLAQQGGQPTKAPVCTAANVAREPTSRPLKTQAVPADTQTSLCAAGQPAGQCTGTPTVLAAFAVLNSHRRFTCLGHAAPMPQCSAAQ